MNRKINTEVFVRDLLLDYCTTEREAEKIKKMNYQDLINCLFINVETGIISMDEIDGSVFDDLHG